MFHGEGDEDVHEQHVGRDLQAGRQTTSKSCVSIKDAEATDCPCPSTESSCASNTAAKTICVKHAVAALLAMILAMLQCFLQGACLCQRVKEGQPEGIQGGYQCLGYQRWDVHQHNTHACATSQQTTQQPQAWQWQEARRSAATAVLTTCVLGMPNTLSSLQATS